MAGRESSGPRPSRASALGALIAGFVIMPSDGTRRDPGKYRPVRHEVAMVVVVAGVCIVLGGLAGWFLIGGDGVVLGLIVGLFGSMVPASIGTAVLRRRS